MVAFSKIMTERLLIRALKGGSNTKIITLNGKKMTKMPSALERLPALKTLDLRNNLISKVCPELSTLTQLTLLNLGNNLLEEVPEELKYLTSLKKLHLFGNRICRIAPGVWDGLQKLILLNLNDNQLESLPQEVGRLRNLTYLSIDHNQLTMIPKELCSLENLLELHLNYNQLMCIPEEIKLLKNLQQLFLVRNNIEVLPQGLCQLEKLRLLDIAGNVIQIFPAGFQKLNLREFYCEGNPLFLKRPITTEQPKDIWTLREIAARFVLCLLEENNDLIMNAIEYYPEAKEKISKARKCALCRKPFLSEWLECVQFVSPSKNWKISRNLQLIPLRILLCSHECFRQRGRNVFGIAQE
ncbi:leucine-rich repeat-containing protein 69 [Cricetulus griseus]|uniref:Leucine-rich repeat-containing protein 69 n=2 Tax=Cricetulus griseus TaxID=10029 RepID=A0A9J7FJS5_CRIGR|nr:leucine-rich repeat-containing protein 69 [Cricetulus griseus]XP_027293962.1 leucine-rich repeat-containing protein 69 [Cricetulus griseus]